jgi:hypothetical protein
MAHDVLVRAVISRAVVIDRMSALRIHAERAGVFMGISLKID